MFFFFFKQKTAYEMRISDWSSDVCSSDLRAVLVHDLADHARRIEPGEPRDIDRGLGMPGAHQHPALARDQREDVARRHDLVGAVGGIDRDRDGRSEKHTSELQSLMRTSYAVFCLKNKNKHHTQKTH